MAARLLFPVGDHGNMTEEEMEQKGYWYWVAAEVDGVGIFPLTFAIPNAFGAPDERMDERGDACWIEPTLVVIPELTRARMECAVQWLYENHYFDQFVPFTKDEMVASLARKVWPPDRPPRLTKSALVP